MTPDSEIGNAREQNFFLWIQQNKNGITDDIIYNMSNIYIYIYYE